MGRPHLTTEERALAFRLRAKGLTFKEVGEQLDASLQTAWNVLMKLQKHLLPGGNWTPRPGRLTLADREEISLGLRGGETFSAIAKRLDRQLSTVSREVAANGGRGVYRAWRAHQRARQCALRPKPRKLASVTLADQVTQWLSRWWSPQEIAQRLRIEYPDDPMMWVSHETIYKTLFVQRRGELGRELSRCLRSGRVQRRLRGWTEKRGQIPGMVNISEWPAEADDRAVPGHWEGDLIIGKNGRSQVGTLVERSTRYVMLLHLPDGRFPAQVDEAMHRHAGFTVDTGIQVYFCDPHSPWQRGSNENTNGLLRQYMPRGTDLSALSAQDLARFAASLNDRPRATLGFMKPSERLAELLALTG